MTCVWTKGRRPWAAQPSVRASAPVNGDSSVAGETIPRAQLLAGFLITFVSPGDQVYFPADASTLEIGDRLIGDRRGVWSLPHRR